MTAGTLVVGYGNALRGDDGIGWHAASLLAADPRLVGSVVLQRHQLLPELALDISEASLVVLVDASHALPVGSVTVTRVGVAGQAGATWSHHLGPSSLVALANELYGGAPEVFLVSVGAQSFQVGDQLSAVVAATLPRVVDAVAELVAERGTNAAADPFAEETHA